MFDIFFVKTFISKFWLILYQSIANLMLYNFACWFVTIRWSVRFQSPENSSSYARHLVTFGGFRDFMAERSTESRRTQKTLDRTLRELSNSIITFKFYVKTIGINNFWKDHSGNETNLFFSKNLNSTFPISRGSRDPYRPGHCFLPHLGGRFHVSGFNSSLR